MTDLEIKQTIEETKKAIRNKIGSRTSYAPALKSAIIAAAKVIGPSQFSRESGLSIHSLYNWSGRKKRSDVNTSQKDRRLNLPPHKQKKGITQPESQPLAQGNLVRSIEVVSVDSMNGFCKNGNDKMAIVRAGNQLEIQIPVDSLSPEWVAEVVKSLKQIKERDYA